MHSFRIAGKGQIPNGPGKENYVSLPGRMGQETNKRKGTKGIGEMSAFHVDTWTLDNIVVTLTMPSRGLPDIARELGLGVRESL